MDKLLKALKENLCVVTYKKIDTGELREMECTLSPNLIPFHKEMHQRPESDNILVWCTDKNAWRSFRASTMTEWHILD